MGRLTHTAQSIYGLCVSDREVLSLSFICPSVPCCRRELSSSPMISAKISSSTMWPKSSQHSHNADEKYDDWIQIPPPSEDDRIPTGAKGDARPWTLASWCIPALWLLVLFLAWVFAQNSLVHHLVCLVGNIYTESCRATLPLNANSLRQGGVEIGGIPIMIWRFGRLVPDQAGVSALVCQLGMGRRGRHAYA